MINISKANEDPKPLKDFKIRTQNSGPDKSCNYSLFTGDEKNDYKKELLKEQYYLCAYCNRNLDEFVSDDKLHQLKIEHWFPQSLCKEERHIYNTLNGRDVSHENMLIVCPGQNVNPDFTHCDSSRTKRKTLTIKPQDPSYEFYKTFRYEGGLLKSNNKDIQEDVDKELKLNDTMLVQRRNRVLDQVIKLIVNKGNYNKQALLQMYSTPTKENRLRAYCTIIIYYINNNMK